MNKFILKITATIALLAQVLIPMWWGAVWLSIGNFWIEGVVEGGIFGTEVVMGVDNVGESIIGKCFLGQTCSFSSLLWGLFSVYAILAITISIKTLLIKNVENQILIHTKRDIIYLIINILTIILTISFIYWNGGVIPKL